MVGEGAGKRRTPESLSAVRHAPTSRSEKSPAPSLGPPLPVAGAQGTYGNAAVAQHLIGRHDSVPPPSKAIRRATEGEPEKLATSEPALTGLAAHGKFGNATIARAMASPLAGKTAPSTHRETAAELEADEAAQASADRRKVSAAPGDGTIPHDAAAVLGKGGQPFDSLTRPRTEKPPKSPALTVDAVSGAGGSPPLAEPREEDAGGCSAELPIPAPLASLSRVSATAAPGMISVAAAAATTLGSQLSVNAYAQAPTGPMPTGLPIGIDPIIPQDPSIPEAGQLAPSGDTDPPGALEAVTREGAAQLESGRRAVELASHGDMGVNALSPTLAPAQIPPLGLAMVYPAAGPPPIDASADPEVGKELENTYGPRGRETASRELTGGRAMLAQHAVAIEAQHSEATELLRAESDKGALEQVAAREEARMAVEQDKARLLSENAEAIQKYQRDAAVEHAAAAVEVQRAKEVAKTTAATQREEAQEDDDEAWYERAWGAVKSGTKVVAGAVKGAVVKTYQFVRDRVTRFFSRVRELVIDGISALREIGRRIYRGIRDKIHAVLGRINEIARRIGAFVIGIVRRVGSVISSLIGRVVGFFRGILGAIADFWRKVWGFAGKVKEFIVMMANGAIDVMVELIEDPKAVLEKAKGTIQELVNATPGKVEEVYQEHLAPLLDTKSAPGPKPVMAGVSSFGLPLTVQQQENEAEVSAEAKETHSEGIWRHLKVRGKYFLEHWWEVVLDAALEILIPGVALYRHLPQLWEAMKEGWRALKAGEWSHLVDAGLDAGREVMAIFASFIAQVSIAAFIIGSVLGTPIVGAAALEAIGLFTIGVDAALQVATIAKSASNLDDADEDEKRLETDYGRVADSSIALAVMLALVLLGAIASATASSLVRRFPALGRAAEALKNKLQRGLGLKARRPTTIQSKLKPLDAIPPEALDVPIRKDLLPREQIAFDKWVAERRDAGVDVKKALAGKTPDQVRGMIRRQLDWVSEQEARKAHNTQWEGEMLDPKMANGPRQEGGKDVWSRWNEKPPAEIDEGIRLNQRTGERVDLFGDDFPGIDGTLGKPPRPLQLKAVPSTEDVATIPRVAGEALTKARDHGFSRVEVSIEAPGRTVAQVREAFARNPAKFTDSTGVTRVRIWCDDGMFEPTSFRPVIPPPHPDLDPDKNKVPAGAVP